MNPPGTVTSRICKQRHRPEVADIKLARIQRANLIVDHNAIRRNVEQIRQIAPGARIMGVIKGNAYGLGAVPVARTLASCGVQAFAVDNVAEGLELRAAGIELPIMVIDGDTIDNAEAAVRFGLTPGIADAELLSAYDRAAEIAGLRHPVWLVANVGFNRSGEADPERFSAFVRKAAACRHLEVTCVYAHMSNSHADENVSMTQIRHYTRLVEQARAVLGQALQTSLFASHGIPRWGMEMPTDWVRPGLLLYGEHMYAREHISEPVLTRLERFMPAVELRARILRIIGFERDECVGYGLAHKVRAGQRLAVLSFGFGRGYPPGVSSAHAGLGHRKCPVIGAVGMDAMQVDVTDDPTPETAGWAVLIGTIGGHRFGVTDLAKAGRLSPYELLTRLDCGRSHLHTQRTNEE